MNNRMRSVVGVLALAVAVNACASETTGPGGGDPGDGNNGGINSDLANNIVNPVVFEAFLRDTWLDLMAGVTDGLDRVLDSSKGFSVQGVSVISSGAGFLEAFVDVDLDGDGALESSVRVNINGDISSGGTINITEITAPGIPSYLGNLTANVSETSEGVLQLTDIGGSSRMDEPGSMNAADVTTTGGTLELAFDAGSVLGALECLISGEGRTLIVTLTFEENGALRVTGDGIDFTIP